MVTNIAGEMFPDLAIHPGRLLAEELAERGLTQKALAEQIGRPTQVINEIVRGKKAITADTAVALEQALGVVATIWLGKQMRYELTLAYNRAAAQAAVVAHEAAGDGDAEARHRHAGPVSGRRSAGTIAEAS